jgi:hypothetical protein
MHTWYQSGIYYDTIPNIAGCDSVITCLITINTSQSVEQHASACSEFYSPSGNQIGIFRCLSGYHNGANGCNVYHTVFLTISEVDTSVFLSGDTLLLPTAVPHINGIIAQAILLLLEQRKAFLFLPAIVSTLILQNGACVDTSTA